MDNLPSVRNYTWSTTELASSNQKATFHFDASDDTVLMDSLYVIGVRAPGKKSNFEILAKYEY